MDESKQQFELITTESSKKAADALQKIVNKPVTMSMPGFQLKSIDILDKIKGDMVIGISEISGDLQGNLLLCYSRQKVLSILETMLMLETGSLKDVNEDAMSAYVELLNIIAGAFLSSMADRLDLRLFPNPPKYIGNIKTIEQELYDDLKSGVENIFLIATELSIESVQSSGNLYMLLHSASLDYIINRIKQIPNGKG
jgi:chemotaxis protein CheY-P-specific phosphatase CheC